MRATYLVNGSVAATGGDGETITIPMPGRCALVRAVVGESSSAPVYVDCPWAERSTVSDGHSSVTGPPRSSARL